MTPDVQAFIDAPALPGERVFAVGETGSGKSTLLTSRTVALLEQAAAGPETLVLLPDRGRAVRWRDTLAERLERGYALPRVTTFYSLASASLRNWWPEISASLAESRPEAGPGITLEPTILTYESAQYLMSEIVTPRLERGYFEGLAMRPQRIVSQLLDNLNKAALNGYALEEVQTRLSRAWIGPSNRLRHYEQMQDCVQIFRGRCLDLGLVDVSLIIELFRDQIMGVEPRRRRVLSEIRHLLVDDLDESTPAMQDFVRAALDNVDSALLTYDPFGGQRVFLGAEPNGAWALSKHCTTVLHLDRQPPSSPGSGSSVDASMQGPRALARLAAQIYDASGPQAIVPEMAADEPTSPAPVLAPSHLAALAANCVTLHLDLSSRGKMVEEAATIAAAWIREGLAAQDIAIVAPYLDGGLRFTLVEALAARGIAAQARRRHRMLREEPEVRAALTAAMLANPDWGLPPGPYSVAEALSQLEPGIDAARASLLARGLFDRAKGRLLPVDRLDMQDHDRIGFPVLEGYAALQTFLNEAAARSDSSEPVTGTGLGEFLRALFDYMASRHRPDLESAQAFDQLLASVDRFEDVAPRLGLTPESAGPAFLRLVRMGTVTAQHLPAVSNESATAAEDAGQALHISPVHSYLVDDLRHPAQIWLAVGSLDWWRPPQQPLTNPWVLSRSWPAATCWSPELDAKVRDRVLGRLCSALAARADDRLALLGCAEGRLGVPSEGPLLRLTDLLEAKGGHAEGHAGAETEPST